MKEKTDKTLREAYTKAEIQSKVRVRESQINFLTRCKRVFVCPNCGGNLDFYEPENKHVSSLQCQDCKGIW